MISMPGLASSTWKSWSISLCLSSTGSSPLPRRIVLENIRKDGAITQRKPYSKSAQGRVRATNHCQIGLSDEDACTLVHGEVKYKVGIGLCFFGIQPAVIVKEVMAKTPCDPLQAGTAWG